MLITLFFIVVPIKSEAIYWNQTKSLSSVNNGNMLTVLTSTLTSEEIETVVTYTASLSTTTVTTEGVITQYTTWCPLTNFALTTSTTYPFLTPQGQNIFSSGYSKSLNDIPSSNNERTTTKFDSNSVDVIISSSTISSNITSKRYPSSSTFYGFSDSSYSISPSHTTLSYSESVTIYTSNNSSKSSTNIYNSSSLFFETQTTATTSELSKSTNTTITSELISQRSSIPLSIPTSSFFITNLTTSEAISTRSSPSTNTTFYGNIPASEAFSTTSLLNFRMSSAGLSSATSSLGGKYIFTSYALSENTSIRFDTSSSKLPFSATTYTSSVITTSTSSNTTSIESELPLTSSPLTHSQILPTSVSYSVLTITTTSNGIVTLYTTWCPLTATAHENIQSFRHITFSPLSSVTTKTGHVEASLKLSSNVESTHVIELPFSPNTTSKTKVTTVSTGSAFTILSSSSSFAKKKSFTVSTRIITTSLHSTFTTTKEGLVIVVTTWCPVTSTKTISIESCSKHQCIFSSSTTINLVSSTRNAYTSTITVTSTRRRSSMVDVPKFRLESATTTITKKHTKVISIELCSNGECRMTDASTTSTTSTTASAGCSDETCTVIRSNTQFSSIEISPSSINKKSSCFGGICTTSITERTKESIISLSEFTTSTTTLANSCQGDACGLSVSSFIPMNNSKRPTSSKLTKIKKVTSTAVIESCTDGKCLFISSTPSSLYSTIISKSSPVISSKITSFITTVTTTFHGAVTHYTTWCPLLVTCKDNQCESGDITTISVEKASSTVPIAIKHTTSIVTNKIDTNTEAVFNFMTSIPTTNVISSVLPTFSKKARVSTSTNGSQSVASTSSKIIISSTATNQKEKLSSENWTELEYTTVPASTRKDSIYTTCSTTFTPVYLTPIMTIESDTSVSSNVVITTTTSNRETTNTITSNNFNTQVPSSKSIQSAKSIETLSSSFPDSVINSCSDSNLCHRVTSNLATSDMFSSSYTISYNATPVITTYLGSAEKINKFGGRMISLLLLLII